MKAFFLHLFIFSLTVAGAIAYVPIDETNAPYVESRIKVLNNDTYFINWSEDGNEYQTDALWKYGIRKVFNSTFSVIEIDPHMAQYIRVEEVDYKGEFTRVSIKIVENPNDPYPAGDVPLRACVNGTKVFNAKRFEVPNTFCGEGTQYYLDRVPFDSWFTIRFNIHPTPYVWWLGELDPDGTYGQGGGGDGVQICQGVTISLNLNETQILVNQSFDMSFSADYFPVQAGCSISTERVQSLNDDVVWRVIQPYNTSKTNVECNDASCIVNPASWGTTYTKSIKCYAVGNRTLRSRYTGTKSGNPYSVNSLNKNIECINPSAEEEETINNTILAGILGTENYSITNTDYFPFINFSLFANGTNKTFSLLSSFNVAKLTGGGSNEVRANITIDGVEIIESGLRTVSKDLGNIDEGVTGLRFINFTLDEGDHELIVYFKRSGNGEVEINDLDLILLQFLTEDFDDVNYKVINPNYAYETLNYSEAYNFSYNSTSSPVAFFGKFTSANNETALNSYAYKNLLTGDISSYFYRYLANAGDTGSLGTLGIDDNKSEIKNYTIISRVSNGEGINNASILIFDLEDNNTHSIQHFYSGNASTNDTANLTLTEGTHLIDSVTINITTGNGILISGTYSFKSSSGTQTPTFWFNSSNIAKSNCYSKKERYLSSNDDFGNAFYYDVCKTTELNKNNTFNFWVTVPTGETLILLDEAFTGIVTTDIDLTAGTVPPLTGEGLDWLIYVMPLLFLMGGYYGAMQHDKVRERRGENG